jgi:hypothetical protein
MPPKRPSSFRNWFGTRSRKTKLGIGCGTIIAALLLCICAASAYGSANVATTITPTPTKGQAAILNSPTVNIPTGTPTQKPTPIPTKKPTQTPTQKPQPKSIAQQINDIVLNAGMLGTGITNVYGSDSDPKSVLVKDNIGDGNLTNSLTVGEIHLECFDAQKALWTSNVASYISYLI